MKAQLSGRGRDRDRGWRVKRRRQALCDRCWALFERDFLANNNEEVARRSSDVYWSSLMNSSTTTVELLYRSFNASTATRILESDSFLYNK